MDPTRKRERSESISSSQRCYIDVDADFEYALQLQKEEDTLAQQQRKIMEDDLLLATKLQEEELKRNNSQSTSSSSSQSQQTIAQLLKSRINNNNPIAKKREREMVVERSLEEEYGEAMPPPPMPNAAAAPVPRVPYETEEKKPKEAAKPKPKPKATKGRASTTKKGSVASSPEVPVTLPRVFVRRHNFETEPLCMNVNGHHVVNGFHFLTQQAYEGLQKRYELLIPHMESTYEASNPVVLKAVLTLPCVKVPESVREIDLPVELFLTCETVNKAFQRTGGIGYDMVLKILEERSKRKHLHTSANSYRLKSGTLHNCGHAHIMECFLNLVNTPKQHFQVKCVRLLSTSDNGRNNDLNKDFWVVTVTAASATMENVPAKSLQALTQLLTFRSYSVDMVDEPILQPLAEGELLTQPNCIALTLKPFQLETVSRMVRQERRGSSLGIRLPLHWTVQLSGEEKMVFDTYISTSTEKMNIFPSTAENCGGRFFGGVLAHEMGLGKTAQYISLCAMNPFVSPSQRRGPSGRTPVPTTFIITTVTLVGQIEREILKVWPQARVLRFYSPKRFSVTVAQLLQCDFLVTTHSTAYLKVRETVLPKVHFHRIILDEFQDFRSHSFTHDVTANSMWCVSGTPRGAIDFFHNTGFHTLLRYSYQPPVKDRSVGPILKLLECPAERFHRLYLDAGICGMSEVATINRPRVDDTTSYSASTSIILANTLTLTRSDIPPEQIALPPRTIRTQVFDMRGEEYIVYMGAIGTIIRQLHAMPKHIAVQNLGSLRNWLVHARTVAVNPAMMNAQQMNVISDFDVQKRIEKCEFQWKTARQLIEIFEANPAQVFAEALRRFLHGMMEIPPQIGDVTCALCLDIFRCPTVLDCGHVFCRECLQDLRNVRSGELITCPHCRANTVMAGNKYMIAPEEEKKEDAEDQGKEEPKTDDLLIPTHKEMNKAMEELKKHLHCSRVEAVINLMKTLKQAAKQAKESAPKFVVFSFSTELLAAMSYALSAHNILYIMIDGSVGMEQRARMTGRFQNLNDDTEVCLLSMRAASAGLTLTAANHIILMEPATNSGTEQQAMARAYRLGQNRPVTVHRMAARNTVDERMYQMLDAGELTSVGLERFDRVGSGKADEIADIMGRILCGMDFRFPVSTA